MAKQPDYLTDPDVWYLPKESIMEETTDCLECGEDVEELDICPECSNCHWCGHAYGCGAAVSDWDANSDW